MRRSENKPAKVTRATRATKATVAPVGRICISMEQDLLQELDRMVEERGFESRSQAIGDMARQQLAEHKRQLGDAVMAGTITVVYDRTTRGLQKNLSDLQYRNLTEVISSLHVNLAEFQTMEVILVQGPAQKLQAIANEIITQKGVLTGRLLLTAAVLPPLHQ
ncbi:CopG family transcriptional regulator [Betaproteobacteria bacterium]|nr:CopG family transcriptional regulator [Betaproteobacteria bacterium]GHU41492.1 CopG family transcriptional regulator [Betaproteobacteria bacterium]